VVAQECLLELIFFTCNGFSQEPLHSVSTYGIVLTAGDSETDAERRNTRRTEENVAPNIFSFHTFATNHRLIERSARAKYF
jgi:hypothetical protein